MNTEYGKLVEFLKNKPILFLGTHPVLGDILFNVVKTKKDEKDRMVISWEQKFDNTVNRLVGRTVFYVTNNSELKVVNDNRENVADIAGMVVNSFAKKFNLTTKYDRRNPATFKREHILI